MQSILILGGTNFIGRNLIERLLKLDGYEITLFNRQRTSPDLFPEAEQIKGDRETKDIDRINDKNWNYIIDLSCYYPDSLERILNSINSLDKYIFISTCSAYDNEDKHTLLKDEQSKLLTCSAEQKTDNNPASYGNRKAACERLLKKSGLPYIILRPALVFGKHDPTDRLYYWLHQVKKNTVLLLPENGERLFSSTYVSDLVETIILSLKSDISSETYNVITQPKTSIKQIIDVAKQSMKKDNSIVNASADFLKQQGINQWTDMPLWINGNHFTYSNEKLKKDLGLIITDFRVCLKKTLEYYENLDWPTPKYGMSENKRQHLMKIINS